LRGDTTAERATILLFRDDVRSWVTMLLHNLVVYDQQRGLFRQERTPIGPIDLQTSLRESPEFLSLAQLRSLRDTPERYGQIGTYKTELADAIAAAKLR